MPPRRVPILAKLLGAYLVPTVATFAGFGAVAHYVARRALDAELGRRLASVAAAWGSHTWEKMQVHCCCCCCMYVCGQRCQVLEHYLNHFR